MISQKHTLIHHFLEQSAQTCPDKVAIIQDDVRASYTKINSEANQIAHWLISQGIKTGDRVVLILENNPEYVVSYYGVLKAGAVAVSLNNDIKPEGLKHVLREIKPRIIISSSKF